LIEGQVFCVDYFINFLKKWNFYIFVFSKIWKINNKLPNKLLLIKIIYLKTLFFHDTFKNG